MKRGDVVTVALSGDYGKPRPAVIVQSDLLPSNHASVVVCQMTSELERVSTFRVGIEPSAENALRVPSQVMADKAVAILRERVGRVMGHLSTADMGRIDVALALVLGLAIASARS
jgi:mRNA interferase MazF